MTAEVWLNPGAYVHHPEHPQPCGHTVKIAQRPFQIPQDRQPDQLRCVIPLLNGQLGPEFAQRTGNRPIRILRRMAGDVRLVAAHNHLPERQHQPRRRLERLRQLQPQPRQFRFYLSH